MAGTLFVGTSGFAFDGWKGPFYPADLKSKGMLAYYASRLRSVEINYTFRRHPSSSTLTSWRETTPDGFAFSIKAHQRITHVLRLANAEEAVKGFLDRVKELGPRLGPILFQCPPTMKFESARLEGFLAALPTGLRYAFEFRHASWGDEAKALIAARGAAYCLADTDEEPFEGAEIAPGKLVYLRLRRTTYSEPELEVWAKRIRGALARDAEVFCYFKHEDEGLGPKLALRLGEIVAKG